MPSYTKPEFDCYWQAVRAMHFAKAQGLTTDNQVHNLRTADVALSRNILCQAMLDEGYSHIWFVDDDTSVPEDALVKLLRLNAPIATGITPTIRNNTIIANVVRIDGNDMEPWAPTDIFKCKSAGASCLLIAREVIETIRENGENGWFNWLYDWQNIHKLKLNYVGEDTYFCTQARRLGFDIVCDSSIQCGHTKTIDLLDVFKLAGNTYGKE